MDDNESCAHDCQRSKLLALKHAERLYRHEEDDLQLRQRALEYAESRKHRGFVAESNYKTALRRFEVAREMCVQAWGQYCRAYDIAYPDDASYMKKLSIPVIGGTCFYCLVAIGKCYHTLMLAFILIVTAPFVLISHAIERLARAGRNTVKKM